MGIFVFAIILGLAIATPIVSVAIIRKRACSFPAVAVSAVVAIAFVFVVATIAAYFLMRVRIGDHYEVNFVLMTTFIVWPATVGALVGAVCGGFLAYKSVRPPMIDTLSRLRRPNQSMELR